MLMLRWQRGTGRLVEKWRNDQMISPALESFTRHRNINVGDGGPHIGVLAGREASYRALKVGLNLPH